MIDTSNANNAQYGKGARYAYNATDIVVGSAQTVDLGTIATVPRTFTFTHTDGIDRFAVSADVSQARFVTVPATGVPVVSSPTG